MAETGVEVFGVSPDSVKRHVKFREKYTLPYRLLSDEGHRVAEAFGVWVEKTFAGRTYFGTERTTFIIGADGRIEQVLPQVKPAAHVEQLLEALAGVRDEPSAVCCQRCGRLGPAARGPRRSGAGGAAGSDPVTWVVIAVALVLWLMGVILRIGQWVNLLLVLAAVLIVYQVIVDRRSGSE